MPHTSSPERRPAACSYHDEHRRLQAAAARQAAVAAEAEHARLWQERHEQQQRLEQQAAAERKATARAALERADQEAADLEAEQQRAEQHARLRQHIVQGSSELRDLQRLLQASRPSAAPEPSAESCACL